VQALARARQPRHDGPERHVDDGRAWLLTIVRRTAYTWLARRRDTPETPASDDLDAADDDAPTPEELLIERADREIVRAAIEALPLEFREILVLREFEELSYKEIAAVVDVPLGTVMSRLARARERLLAALRPSAPMEVLR